MTDMRKLVKVKRWRNSFGGGGARDREGGDEADEAVALLQDGEEVAAAAPQADADHGREAALGEKPGRMEKPARMRSLPGLLARCYLFLMSTFTEVAVAADALSREEQRKLLQHIAATLSSAEEWTGRNMHELMKDGCGIVDSGVTDLASNKDHLRGYGR